MRKSADPLQTFHSSVRDWFRATFPSPTEAQARAWPPIQRGESTLLLAPTGSGKTLAAFLVALDRLMFSAEPDRQHRCRVLYISPLKALAVDVERNLQTPLLGIAAVATRAGSAFRHPTIAIRSGDTPASERARMARNPPDIWITTPESFFLLLTSSRRELLRSVETVIIDEIHSVVATKRGAHLFLSLERLEELRDPSVRLQRIGLSATQRPIAEVARLLGGNLDPSFTPPKRERAARHPRRALSDAAESGGRLTPRPVEIVDAGIRRAMDLHVEVPVEDMANPVDPSAAARPPGAALSIWPAIQARVVELIRRHRSTMIFVNSRRLAERLAAAINDTGGEELALAHHGSVARDKRRQLEERLKAGLLPAIVATSSLELGIDMGAVDLVIQIEAPPSVASGLQRIGRAGHSVTGVSRGMVIPKHRGDLLAAAAAARCMMNGAVEEMFAPANPLDVLAQQLVAMAAMDAWPVDRLYQVVRRAAPFAQLPRTSFEGVLDMLSGRYPSDEFAGLRARITWDRKAGIVRGREGARQIAVINGGTIPDRGLYGVFLMSDRAGASVGTADGGDDAHATPATPTTSKPERNSARAGSRRVGELDEEMVFESKPGDVFILGASSWRIEDITHDRVLVTPAPGRPGRTPFWHGDRPGRPLELGRAIGELTRTIASPSADRDEAIERLVQQHALDERTAINLVKYVQEQATATGEVPSDRCIIVERYVDDMGDFRVCVLTPFGSRVHAPWATAIVSAVREAKRIEIESLWSDDGMVFRFPQADQPPDVALFLPSPDTAEDVVVHALAQTSLFASRFRENAARALLLPRRRPGKRSPLWAQRQRAADLLAVASQYPSFPMLLETYRELLRDVFDLPGLVGILRDIRARKLRVACIDSRTPSPFTASLLFSYVGNFLYDQDAPVAERRAQMLSLDLDQLRELLGQTDLRELLDPEVIRDAECALQRRPPLHPLRHPDALHDLLLALGDLSLDEMVARGTPAPPTASEWLESLCAQARISRATIGGEPRFIANEDAARYRDGLGVDVAPNVPATFLEPVAHPLVDLVSRYARTHGPFTVAQIAERFAIDATHVQATIDVLTEHDRVVPLGTAQPSSRDAGATPADLAYCDVDVLRTIKRRTLVKLRTQIEPVPVEDFARFSLSWHGVGEGRAGSAALAEVIDELQGAAIPASILETEILPARIPSFRPGDLDALCASGEVLFRGIEALGPRDGRVAMYWATQYLELAPPSSPSAIEREASRRVLDLLERRGALFFATIVHETGMFAGDVLEALWELVWAGLLTNDTWAAVRSRIVGEPERASRRARVRMRSLPSRRTGPPGSEGRWSVLPRVAPGTGPTDTERLKALTEQLLRRHGVLTREAVQAEASPGGFAAVYPVLKAMEEMGQLRRGYFVGGLAATQFALPGADNRLRARRRPADAPQGGEPRTVMVSAANPANPYGAALPWPDGEGQRPSRSAGGQVVLHEGRMVAFLGRTERTLSTFVPNAPGVQPDELRRAIAHALSVFVSQAGRRALLISEVDRLAPSESPLAPFLKSVGFVAASDGFLLRKTADESCRAMPLPVRPDPVR